MAESRFQLFINDEDGADCLLHKGRKVTDELQVTVSFDLARYRYNAIVVPTGGTLAFAAESFTGPAKNSLPAVHSDSPHRHENKLESALPTLDSVDSAIFPLKSMREWQIYHFQDASRDSRLRHSTPVRDNLNLHSNGGNLAPVLRLIRERHPENYRRIVETVCLAAPFFKDFTYRKEIGERMELEWFQDGSTEATPFGPRQLSDGTLRFICLATLLNQPEHLKPNPIFIDEPELGLHPFALTLLAEMLKSASESSQIVVSTQSADLVGEFEPEDVVTVSRKSGESKFDRLDEENLQDWLEDYRLGDLWRMSVVGTGPTP